MQYRAVPDGSTVWLYVEDSDEIPTLTGLNEFTEYSIQMALIESNKFCVFSESIIVTTGKLSSICIRMLRDKYNISHYSAAFCLSWAEAHFCTIFLWYILTSNGLHANLCSCSEELSLAMYMYSFRTQVCIIIILVSPEYVEGVLCPNSNSKVCKSVSVHIPY